jgi:starch synthase
MAQGRVVSTIGGTSELDVRLTNGITVLSPYRFHAFELAGQLARHGVLRRLLTAMPRRTVTEVPACYISSRRRVALVRHAFGKLHLPNDPLVNRLVVRDFDRWASRSLSDDKLVVALSSFATSTLAKAAQMGATTVCDRGSWHILEQQRVMNEEASTWNCSPPPFDPWLIDRELDEYETATTVTVPSEPARRSFLRQGTSPARVAKVPYGVDTRRYHRSEAQGRDHRRVICVGHVGLRKGHQYLAPAYRRVRRPGSSLVLVGEAPLAGVRLLGGVDADITLTGPVSRDRVATELRQSGIFALASVEEGLALVIGQAMAAGLPVVASEATGAEELITHGVEGFIVPTGDEGRLSEALDLLLSDEDLARNMGDAAWRRMQSLGGWDRYGDDALAVYRRLISG